MLLAQKTSTPKTESMTKIITPFAIRKWIHIFFGTIFIAVLIFLPHQGRMGITLVMVGFLGIELLRQKITYYKNLFVQIFGKLLKTHEKAGKITGATMFMMIVTLLVWIFPLKIAITALCILTFSDPMASIIGKRFPFKVIWRGKSLGGSVAFFGTTITILLLLLEIGIIPSLLISLVATMGELFSPEIVENFAIGFIPAILLMFTQ